MNRQETFDFVLDAIIGQGGPAGRQEGWQFTCQYRAEDGKRCAIGHLITDEEAEALGGNNVCWAADHGTLPARFSDDVWFYANLQAAHDDAACDDGPFVPLFRKNMASLARRHGLTFPAEAMA